MPPSANALKCFLPTFQTWFSERNPGLSTYNCSRSLFMSELKLYRNTTLDDDLSVVEKQQLIGFINDELKFVQVEFSTSIDEDETTVDKEKARTVADDFADEINNNARLIGAVRMDDTFAASDEWVNVEAELGIVAGFYSGLVICFPVAFSVLLISTQNVLVSVYAIFSILFIVGCVLATIVWGGGALGVSEAVAGVIVIGFSVDLCDCVLGRLCNSPWSYFC